MSSVSDFENVVVSICPNLFSEYGDLPRIAESRKIYQSTPYPADRAILIHNESSHLYCFPLNIWFCCLQPASQGGATPIVDCRKAYRLINKKLQARLIEKKIMYVRNFIQGLDVSWQTFFQTTDKSMVEDYCRRADIDFEWGKQNNLTTRQVRPAIAIHPITNEPVVFNQIQLYHMAYLESEIKESLLSIFGEDRFPRNVYYGDGTPIEDSVLEEINQAYRESQTSFPWEKGDILMLDNMLAAHGRSPYVGKRQIRVAMGEMRYSKDILPSAV
ncbi:syrP protein [Mastigocoleus testarum BC008]|uniref:SyrP protein n=1 Tax=Mastigocoleus testarum BC008 TaxID=371196 RepID=A0A0V8A1D3_9CYAN|nr:syrP protein [Mastigocoleus testarum BC008]